MVSLGIQRLVSTYSNQNPVCSSLNLNGGMFCDRSDFDSREKVRVWHFLGGGVFWDRSDLDSEEKVRVWHFGGGCSGTGQIWTQRKKWEFDIFWEGVFWDRSDLDSESLKFWVGGGRSGPNFRTGCSAQFEHKICFATFWKPLHHI